MTRNLLCYHLGYFCDTAIDVLMFSHNYLFTLFGYTLPSHYLNTLRNLLEYHSFGQCSWWWVCSLCMLLDYFFCLLFLLLHLLHLNSYRFLHKYVSITIIIDSWLQHCDIESDWTIWTVFPIICIIINLNSLSCSEFRWLIISLFSKFVIFWYSILVTYSW